MINIVTGLPGSGKSYLSAQTTLDLLYRNKKWFERSGIKRKVVSNLKMCEEVEREYEGYLGYWAEAEELPYLTGVDVIWEEMGAVVDSRNWKDMPMDLRRWLAQHRHRGVDIYGNVQEFADVDVAVRRLTHSLIYLVKVCGSRDPHPTSPPVKFVWGVVVKFHMDPKKYDSEKGGQHAWLPAGFYFLGRKGVEIYDMHNDIQPGKYPPLQHRLRSCNTCGYNRVNHI